MQNRASPASTVGRAVDLLRLIASSPSQHLRLIDLAQRADMEKSTAHRLPAAATGQRAHARVRIPRPAGLPAGTADLRAGPVRVAENNLRKPAIRTCGGWPSRPATWHSWSRASGFETVCLDRIAGNFPHPDLDLRRGRPPSAGHRGRRPGHPGGDERPGKSISRWTPSRHKLARYPNFSVASLRAAIRHTRETGYALDDGVAASGVSAIGMDIRQPGACRPPRYSSPPFPAHGSARHALLGKHLSACVKGVQADIVARREDGQPLSAQTRRDPR